MIFLFLTLMAVITVVVLAKSKEIYFVSASFKRSKSFLFFTNLPSFSNLFRFNFC